MIAVSVSKDKFFYDIHSLVKAFYPQEEVVCRVRGEQDGADPSEGGLCLDIDLREEAGEICVTLTRMGAGEPAARSEEKCLSGGGPRDKSVRETVPCLPDAAGERTSSIDLSPICGEDGARLYNAKNALKRLLYRLLSEESGRTLPWGSLTGIRPTHIPKTLLQAGWSREAIRKELADTFYVSKEKAALSLEIAEREREILAEEDYAGGYSLYIGIPFCPTTCLYCSFPSYPVRAWEGRIDAYLDAVCRELDFVTKRFRGRPLYTVYVGGGTPTTLAPAQLERLLTAVGARFDLSRVRELTVEAGRPDSLTPEKLAVLAKHAVTRISVNPQTMQQRTLELIGRRHTVEDVRTAYHMARESGDFRINMDLILGLPGESAADVEDTLGQIGELAPDDLTVHALAVKRGSRMQALIEAGKADFAAFDDIGAAADAAQKRAREMGLSPYYLYRQKNIAGNFENTGYAREGAHGLYNILINEDVHAIAACGAGAISKRVEGETVSRAANVRELAQYLDRVDEMIERKAALYE